MNWRVIGVGVFLLLGVWLAFPLLTPKQPVLSSWQGASRSSGNPIGGISGEAKPLPTADASQTTSAIDSYLKDLAVSGQWSGAALVAKHGTVLLANGYGMANTSTQTPNTADTRFRLASVTKQFTAMAIMQLVNANKIQLEASVCAYVDDCPAQWQPITIRNLLTHTSGLPNFTDFASYGPTMGQPTTPAELVARFRDQPLLSQPGTVYRYGNSGYVLLGYIIERVTGKSYSDYVRDHIFGPLGMNDSGYDVGNNHLAQGYSALGVPCEWLDATTLFSAGGLYSSVRDMYRWDQSLYTSKLLPDALRSQIFTPQVGQYGFGWLITSRSGQRVVEHPGLMSGAATHIARLPEAGITVIVLSNLESANVDTISAHLIDLALAAPN